MEETTMNNFERVINMAANLGTVTINSKDRVLQNVKFSIDTYDIYEDSISIASLDGSEMLINAGDIKGVNGNEVELGQYFLTIK